ncbi:Pr6Pr family membrane protein [uncultured Gilliamella sp.]|uniref:Pr6Pr family membrane protein n=1 Tax=uncultured Gilliamella sp. TaxID=1193505 RepID=UPI0025DE7580|nr:Pr6Pr family membrane protein [uncultured Gilliamella sp.]
MLKRNINLFIALYAFFIIGLETYIYWHTKLRPWQPSTPTGRIIFYYSFFTVLSNLMLAFSCLCLTFNPNCNRYSFKVIRLNGLVGVIITAIVYNLILRGIHKPPNTLLQFANESLHVILPIIGVLSWLVWGPFRRIQFNVIVGSFLSMLIYGIYIFIRGYLTNQYPYPFINVVRVGYIKALYAAGSVFLLFLGLALLLWAIDCFRRRI